MTDTIDSDFQIIDVLTGLVKSDIVYDDALSAAKRIYTLINKVESDILSFYGLNRRDVSSSLRKNMADIGGAYMVTLKFVKTFKRVRFYINKDNTEPLKTVMVHYYMKTTNICRDIDQIYREKENYYISLDRLNKFNIGKVYIWGTTPDTTRVDEIYKAPTKSLKGLNVEDVITGEAEDLLYYDVIKSAEFTEVVLDASVIADITLECGSKFSVIVTNNIDRRIIPGAIFVINSLGKYNVFDLSAAKQHLIISVN
jgi:hypothetical protein